jgi:hypothetical protein
MIILAVLVVVFGVAMLIPTRGGRRSPRTAARLAMAVAMLFSEVSHVPRVGAAAAVAAGIVPVTARAMAAAPSGFRPRAAGSRV